MKYFFAFILLAFFSFSSTNPVIAQSAETIWIQTNAAAYKTGETVTVTLNSISATPIQGFTAQIRYDPACLEPVNGTSPISGMNGMAVPQSPGLVDASFASTTPQIANGVLAEIRFVTLKGCQTNLSIETAALVIRNESGFAAPLTGVGIDNKAVSLSIDSEVGVRQPTAELNGSVLPLAPTILPESKSSNWWIVVLIALLVVIAVVTVIVVFKLSRP